MARRILVVEDNHITRRMLRTTLVAAGYEVVEALDAFSALAEVERTNPDLVLLDLVLPDMDGVDLLPRLRAVSAGRDIPVLALSGFLSRFGESRTLDAGFTALLLKPIDPATLVDSVRTYLPSDDPPARTRHGNRLLLVDDDPVQLKLGRLHFSYEGFDVTAVGSANDALAAARREPPSVILSDVFMPDVDGFQLCLQIRQDPRLSTVPVILMSNQYGSAADRDLARRVGADALVLRTPDFEEAQRAVAGALEAPHRIAVEPPTDELRLKHAKLVIQQLERQIAALSGMAQRCSLQSAQISLLSSVAYALTRHTDSEIALRDVLAATLDAAGISKGALLLTDAAGHLTLRQSIGFSEPERRLLATGFGCLPLFDRILKEGAGVLVPSPALSPDESQAILSGANVKAAHIVPLVSDGEALGAVVIGGSQLDVTGDDSVMFARAVGNQVAQSLALARSVTKLTASEMRFRTLFQSANDAIATLTPGGVLEGVNRRWEEILGRPAEELVGHHILEFAPAEYVAHSLQNFVQTSASQGGRAAPTPIKRGDGGIAWMEFSQAAVEIDGHPHVFAIGRDVTERHDLEEQLLQSQKLEAVGQLAGGLAHDFNNVLTAILGFTKLLKDELRGDESRLELLDEVQRAGERAASLTRQLLAFSRKQLLQPRVLNPNELVTSIEPMLRRLIPEHIDLRVALAPDVALVKMDPSQLEQILMNLAVNAAQAMPHGGKLTIETANTTLAPERSPSRLIASPGEYVMLAVSDTGIGMDAATLSHIFEPFFTTKGVGEGTGLGLSTVHGIVKQSGGDIWVYSEPGHGTVFKIFLPVAALNAPATVDKPVAAATTPSRRGAETILLVEDDAGVRAFSRVTLEHAGYQVIQASTPSEAVHVAREWGRPIDLLLSDVVMPDETRVPLFDMLAPLNAGLRVLYMSGYTDEAVVRHGLLLEGTPFLQKPFTPDMLLDKVREVIAGRPPAKD